MGEKKNWEITFLTGYKYYKYKIILFTLYNTQASFWAYIKNIIGEDKIYLWLFIYNKSWSTLIKKVLLIQFSEFLINLESICFMLSLKNIVLIKKR